MMNMKHAPDFKKLILSTIWRLAKTLQQMSSIFLLKIDTEVRRIRIANIWILSIKEGWFLLRKKCKIEVQNCRQIAHCTNPFSIQDFSRTILDGFIKHPSTPIRTSSSASKTHFYKTSPRAAFFARFYWLFVPLSQCNSS